MRLIAATTWLLIPTLCAAITLPQTPVLPRYEVVEALGIADSYSSMTIDPASELPAMVFVDKSGLNTSIVRPAPIQRRYYDGWTWQLETLGTANMLDELSYRNLLYAGDSLGRRHVLLLETNGSGFADDALTYLRRDANGNDIREVLGTGAAVSSVYSRLAFTVASDGRPYAAWISNQTSGGGTLIVRRREENGTWTPIDVGATPGIAGTPNFAITPPRAQFTSVDLIWLELTGSTRNVRHARITDALGVTLRNVLSTPTGVPSQYIALAPQGNAEVAIVRATGPMTFAVERRALGVASTNWSCPQDQCLFDVQLLAGSGVAERALALGPGGQRAFAYFDASVGPAFSAADPLNGTPWQRTSLSSFSSPRDVAYDAAGVLHVAGADNSDHRDMSAVRLTGPWRSSRVPQTGPGLMSVPGATSIAMGTNDAPAVFARANAQDLAGALWTLSDGAFVADPLPAGYTVVQSDLAVAEDGTVHLAFRDQQSGHVFHAERGPGIGSGWLVQQVSRGNGVAAFDPLITIGPQGVPRVLYRQVDILAVAAPRSDTGNWLTREAVVGVNSNAHPRAAGFADAELIYVSWFDDQANELRVTSIYGNVSDPGADPAIATSSVPHSANWVLGLTAHDVAITGDGGVGIAYSQTVDGTHAVGYSFFDRFAWNGVGSDPTSFSGEDISTISLDHRYAAGRAPRLAWVQGNTTATQTLRYAEKFFGLIGWAVEDLGNYSISPPVIDLATNAGVRIAYAEGGALRIARRAETIDSQSVFLAADMALGTGYAACICFYLPVDPGVCGLTHEIENAIPRSSLAGTNGSATPIATLNGVRQRFASTPAGRYYLNLFAEHAGEIAGLTISDPTRIEDRVRTLSDLLPGLAAFAAGDGSAFQLNPLMIQSARRVWLGWAAAGSPALANAVNAELTRTNDLNAFANMNFEQWFAALSVGSATDRIFAGGFQTNP